MANTLFQETYSLSYLSAAINATASEDFGNDADAIRKKDRYGSANRLLLVNSATEDFAVLLDGQTSRRIWTLKANSSFVINPEDGIFFSHVRLTNISATNSSADEVVITIGRANPIEPRGVKKW